MTPGKLIQICEVIWEKYSPEYVVYRLPQIRMRILYSGNGKWCDVDQKNPAYKWENILIKSHIKWSADGDEDEITGNIEARNYPEMFFGRISADGHLKISNYDEVRHCDSSGNYKITYVRSLMDRLRYRGMT